MRVNLVTDTIDKNDINQLIKWLQTYPRLTKGSVTIELEEKFADWIGSKYSVFVNSGSSANLLMLYTLIEMGYLNRGDKVVVPALSWSTDLAPVIQLGLEPILVDCNINDLSIDIHHLIKIIKSKQPKVLMLVSVLGHVPLMSHIIDICKANDIILIEDNCEAMGSKFEDTKLGNFGMMSSFSTFFGHHISTIEGGFITTNDDQVYDVLLGLRSHGWDRDLNKTKQKILRDSWKVDDFQAFYTFYFPGFNLRSTDLQAYIGLGQLKKLDFIVGRRNELWKLYLEKLNDDLWKPKNSLDTFTSAFAFPIIAENIEVKKILVDALKVGSVEVRPMICGSLGTQPYYVKRYGEKILKNANVVDKLGFYVPIHHGMDKNDVQHVCDIINRNS